MTERDASAPGGARARLSDDGAAEICRRRFLRPRSVSRLVGYDNDNFRVEDGEGRRYVLKVARPAADHRRLELELTVLRRLEEIGWPGAPRWLRSRHGRDLERVQVDGEELEVRLLSWVEGRPLAELQLAGAQPAAVGLLEALGAYLARLDLALERIAPATDRTIPVAWDLADTDHWLELVARIEEDEVRHRASAALERLGEALATAGTALRRSLIHGDANDHNVLIAERGRRARIVGLIDFGDCGHAPRLFELTIAAAYAGLEAADPWVAVPPLVAGYGAHLPLDERELALLLPAVRARLAVSLAMSAHRRRRGTTDAYVTVSERPARRALERLGGLSDGEALDRLAERVVEPGDG